jgi:hypothetical protein
MEVERHIHDRSSSGLGECVAQHARSGVRATLRRGNDFAFAFGGIRLWLEREVNSVFAIPITHFGAARVLDPANGALEMVIG